MKISTKGRYALRVMIDLAEHDNGEYITLMDIAGRQGISEKYLESIVSMLSKNDFLTSLRGKGGGYKLSRRPEEYTVLSILQCTEGSLAPVACLENKPNKCPKLSECKTITMWENFEKTINDYFGNITIADLINSGNGIDNYVTKDSFSGKTTFTHGDSFKNSCHRIHGHIKSSINIKAVQIDCSPSNSAWAKSSACFFILCQFIIWNNYLSQSLWSHHCILTLFLLFWGQISLPLIIIFYM